MTPEETPRYFYTTHTPHRYASGPSFHTWGPDGEITSLEEAKALAESKRVFSLGDDHCVTTYGVFYKTKDESFDRL
jgi:hypothetical protein